MSFAPQLTFESCLIRYFKVYESFPRISLTRIMKLSGFGRSHYHRILKLTRFLENTSKLLERSTPQLTAASIIFFYLCLNQDYMKQIGITKNNFVSLSSKLSEKLWDLLHAVLALYCKK